MFASRRQGNVLLRAHGQLGGQEIPALLQKHASYCQGGSQQKDKDRQDPFTGFAHSPLYFS